MGIFAAARRPLVQSSAFVNLPLSPASAPPGRSCHGQAKNGHWQCPTTTTTVESALKRETRGAAEASLSASHGRRSARARITRTAASKGATGDAIPPLPLSTAPAAEHAAAHPPEPSFDDRDGTPGASSSGGGGNFEGGVSASDAHAAVQALRAELLDMRKQAAAQAALTAQQALTISGLERTLQKTQEGGSAQPAGQGAGQAGLETHLRRAHSHVEQPPGWSMSDIALMTLQKSSRTCGRACGPLSHHEHPSAHAFGLH